MLEVCWERTDQYTGFR